ncbi:hypothetical protein ACQKMK_11470 [Viridibacillus arvi]|uniref:hypothetical protein n=1 Tax=Viridibacillus arvi TaxID=263475 RepID=UPI003CFD2D0C
MKDFQYNASTCRHAFLTYYIYFKTAINWIVNVANSGLPGAQSEGMFLEGSCFNEKHKGSQNAGYFKNPNEAEFIRWKELANGKIAKIALASQREHAGSLFKKSRKRQDLSIFKK